MTPNDQKLSVQVKAQLRRFHPISGWDRIVLMVRPRGGANDGSAQQLATSFLGLVGVDALAVAAEARAEPVPGDGP